MAGHLGDKAQEIQRLADELKGASLQCSSISKRKERVVKARQMLTDALSPMIISGDPKDWTQWGLNQVCPYCQIQRTEP